jgi:hypothetical protein
VPADLGRIGHPLPKYWLSFYEHRPIACSCSSQELDSQHGARESATHNGNGGIECFWNLFFFSHGLHP